MQLNNGNELVDAEQVMQLIWNYVKSGKHSPQNPDAVLVRENQAREFDFSQLISNKAIVNRIWHIQVEKLITSQRKLLGSLIVLGKKLVRKLSRWYIVPLFEQQVNFNGAITRCLNEIYNFTRFIEGKIQGDQLEMETRLKKELEYRFKAELEARLKVELEAPYRTELSSRTELLQQDMASLAGRIDQLNLSIEEIKAANGAGQVELESRYKASLEHQAGLAAQILELQKSCSHHQTAISQLETVYVDLGNRLTGATGSFQQNLYGLNWKIRRLERQTRHSELGKTNGELNLLESPCGFDYFLFEQRFRGTVEDIQNRQRIYVDYFLGKTNVLDIGCGRGELLELLLEQGVPARGIDLNEDMVDYCQDRGLPVEKSDAVAYLTALPDASLGGVFLGQVVEHLGETYLLQLIELIYTKLKGGGYLIIETPNPLNLGIFASFFYQDLSHQKPVHPSTLEFILGELGFQDIRINFQAPVPDAFKLKLINYTRDNAPEGEALATVNANIGILNNLLFGYQDYAIIAHK